MVAGFLIAGAVFMSSGGSYTIPTANEVAPTEEATLPTPVEAAEVAGVDKDEFEACFDSGKYADEVTKDVSDAIAAGGTGTPYSVLITKSGNQYPISGALPYTTVKAIIEAALAGEEEALASLDAQAGGSVGDMAPVTAEDHIRGSLDADIIIVEYSDFECPFCARFHPTMGQIVNEYDGKVAWVYRQFPLEQIHAKARPLAEGSECVAELGGNDAFWAYTDYVFGG